ncbi:MULTISPECIES: MFS transporter [Gammaproteobacteria]|uniref:MFS transporter n=1 Tax=Gammaproteobacteria TaxID=1236 RepID=UPI001868FF67|nr:MULTISPECIES: MFS transporter [Gammaproteobacteria]
MENIASAPQKNNSKGHHWWAVIALSLATFSVVTTEMLPVGLLNPIRDSFGISTGISGFMIVIPAFIAAFFSPIVVISAGKRDRKTMLLFLALLLVIANIISAYSTTIVQLLIARAIVGFCIGGIWAFAGGLALRLVPEKSIALATSLIFGGVAAASVLGIPMGVFIGEYLGWRGAFIVMGLFSFCVLALMFICLPTLPGSSSSLSNAFFAQFKNTKLILGLLVTLFLVCAHFMVFTYVRPLLQTTALLSNSTLALLLFAYGISGIIGNFIFGIQSAKRLNMTISVITVGILSVFLGFLFWVSSPVMAIVIMLMWGLMYGGVSVALMTWIMAAVPKGIELGSSAYIAVFNLAIALGAYLGGLVVDHYSLNDTLAIAALLIIFALFCVFLSQYTNKAVKA